MDIFEKLKKLSLEHSEPVGKPEFIVVGLGNPGVTYENTRHNAGFMAISALEKKYNFNVTTHKFKALTARAVIGGKNCLVMKPETYMNLSGDAVMEAMNFFKIPLNNIIVIFDDISLDVGHMRIRRKGSAGGHNGIKSIIAQCGGEDFPRIKIGVGKKPSPDYDLADWVLSKFTDDELKTLSDVDGRVCEAVELMVQGRISDAMNSFNR
ncbi:aminoacyl-tRNA hydrolase [uncultured Ruminococcus sp.]|uniref:aminoacyl-tRNA hydrolase n=1 Tax=uncultured Ruminococcus sp. TaxID=165186 RepID=UPI0025DEA988|nr:aminoacyl-tRNA hydrolase [uncultured Ruminococcus sp.]